MLRVCLTTPISAILLLASFTGCGGSSDDSATTSSTPESSTDTSGQSLPPTPPVPTEPALLAGYEVWRGDCKNCHGIGRDGAPLIGSAEEWQPRLTKGRETLYTHAIEGWFSPTYAEMPARGGNDELTDEQVQSAVDYMIWAALGE